MNEHDVVRVKETVLVTPNFEDIPIEIKAGWRGAIVAQADTPTHVLSLTKITGASHFWWIWTLPIWKWSVNQNEQNHLRQTANHRSRACRTIGNFEVSVDSRFGEHVRFCEDTPEHQARGGDGYLQAVRV
jgi:hypothetical protein